MAVSSLQPLKNLNASMTQRSPRKRKALSFELSHVALQLDYIS